MYESKYSRFVTYNTTRFAEEKEILERTVPVSKGAGVPVYVKNNVLYVDDLDNHSITIGGTGCGKSRLIGKNTIRSLIRNGESMVINDPKGELYRSTAAYARRKGVEVKVLNLRSPENSDHWNPLFKIYRYYVTGQYSKAEQEIDDLATDLMSKTINERDRFWDLITSNYFASLGNICLQCSTDESQFTFENILPLCNEGGEDTIRRIIGAMGKVSEAVKSNLHSVLDITSDRTKSCVYAVLHAGIDSLVKNDSLLQLFNSNEIDFYKLAEKPMAIYVVYPDEKGSMDNVVSAFLTQAYTALLDMCDKLESNKLPVRVNFVLDEFSNLCEIERFDNRISQSRSKNIRFHLFIQSMNQLSEKYGKEVADTILSNCSTWICFSSKEIDFLNTLSKLCGNVIDCNGRERPLISSAEMQYFEKGEDGVEVLILRQGVRPYVTKLPYYDKLYKPEETSLLKRKTKVVTHRVKMEPFEWIDLARDYSDSMRDILDKTVTDEELDDEELDAFLKKRFDEMFGSSDDEED